MGVLAVVERRCKRAKEYRLSFLSNETFFSLLRFLTAAYCLSDLSLVSWRDVHEIYKIDI